MTVQPRNRMHWCLKMLNVPCEEYALCSQLGRVHTVQCALLWLTYILFANLRFYQCIWIFVSPVLHWRQLQLVKKKHLLVSLEEALWRFAVKKLNQQHPMEMMLQKPQNEADRGRRESQSNEEPRALVIHFRNLAVERTTVRIGGDIFIPQKWQLGGEC